MGKENRLAPVLWVNLAMAAGAAYGILNDQITVTLAPEYFSVFKRQQFWDLLQSMGWEEAPTRLQAVAIGAAATWWFGLLLGMVVSLTGTFGRRPRLETRQFVRAVGLVLLAATVTSLLFGGVAYLAEPALKEISRHEESVFESALGEIRSWRSFFAVGWWHNGAYLGGFLGTILACVRVWQWRRAG